MLDFCSFILGLLPHGHKLTTIPPGVMSTVQVGRRDSEHKEKRREQIMSTTSITFLAKKTEVSPKLSQQTTTSISLARTMLLCHPELQRQLSNQAFGFPAPPVEKEKGKESETRFWVNRCAVCAVWRHCYCSPRLPTRPPCLLSSPFRVCQLH